MGQIRRGIDGRDVLRVLWGGLREVGMDQSSLRQEVDLVFG
jgi:hypothetical protein